MFESYFWRLFTLGFFMSVVLHAIVAGALSKHGFCKMRSPRV